MIESLSQPFTFLNASFWAFMLVVLVVHLWPSSSFLPSRIGGLAGEWIDRRVRSENVGLQRV